VFTNVGGDILYIGQAIRISTRLLQHLDAGRHREMTPLGVASLVSILILESAIHLNAYEKGWLDQCKLADGLLPPLTRCQGIWNCREPRGDVSQLLVQ
jgi:hypothetical protein